MPPAISNWSKFKLDLEAALFEFIGTVMFLFLGLGGIQAAADSSAAEQGYPPGSGGVPTPGQLINLAAAMGLSLLVTAWCFYRVTGSIFNIQIGLALMLCGAISPIRFLFMTIAQIIGGIVAAALLEGLIPGPVKFNTKLGYGTGLAQGVWLEAFMTAALVLVVLMLAAEKHKSSFLAPVGIGLTLFVIHIIGGPYTGPSVNSIRSFGPSVIAGFPGHHWIYWVGPTIGSLLATAIYMSLTSLKYWEINPGQESEILEESPRRTLGIPGVSNVGRALRGNAAERQRHSEETAIGSPSQQAPKNLPGAGQGGGDNGAERV